MSPPCQPYTRQGLQLGARDARSESLQHLLTLLSTLARPPPYLLLENVKGFETSSTRNDVLTVLRDRGYTCKEYLLCPSQLGVPNSRLRYYLLASRDEASVQRRNNDVDSEADDSSNAELTPDCHQEVSRTFPACVCLPWNHQTPASKSAGTTTLPGAEEEVCGRCGQPVKASVSRVLLKHHLSWVLSAGRVQSVNGDSHVPSANGASHVPSVKGDSHVQSVNGDSDVPSTKRDGHVQSAMEISRSLTSSSALDYRPYSLTGDDTCGMAASYENVSRKRLREAIDNNCEEMKGKELKTNEGEYNEKLRSCENMDMKCDGEENVIGMLRKHVGECCTTYSEITPSLKHYLQSVRDCVSNHHQQCCMNDCKSLPQDTLRTNLLEDQCNPQSTSIHTNITSSFNENTTDCWNRYLLKEKVLLKYGKLLDIVDDSSRRSCCFTKGYSRLVEGTGSVFLPTSRNKLDTVFKLLESMEENKRGGSKLAADAVKQLESMENNQRKDINESSKLAADDSGSKKNDHTNASEESISTSIAPDASFSNETRLASSQIETNSAMEENSNLEMDHDPAEMLLSLQLRHFSPAEALRLMGFPSWFQFPTNLTDKQQYQLIGNSVNVLVVSVLLAVLLGEKQ